MKVRHLIPDQAFGTPLGSVVVELNRLRGLSGGSRSHSYTSEHLVLNTAAKHSQLSHTHSNADIFIYMQTVFAVRRV